MAISTDLFDNHGRRIHPALFNTAKDGSGTWYLALVDSDGHLQVDALSIATGTTAIGRVGHDTTGIGHGVKTVTTAGTDVVLAASTACKWVIIQAQTDNTSKIAVGATGVDATIATGTGILLDPGDVITILDDNLADIYLDSLVSGEGARYTYGT